MGEEHERAKFVESDDYRYLVVHGLVFDTTTEEDNTPKLDIVFAKNFIITSHRESLPWLNLLLEEAKKNDPEEHLMSRGMAFLLDVYLTTVSNRLNEVMKQLTIIATIFMPITFITGVFGMNFGHLPQVEHDSGALFWITLLGMGIITLMQIWYFRRRKWL